MKNVVPVIMAGIIAVSAYTLVELKSDLIRPYQIYGLVVSVLISGNRMYLVIASHRTLTLGSSPSPYAAVPGLCPTWRGSFRRTCRSCCWLCHWYRR